MSGSSRRSGLLLTLGLGGCLALASACQAPDGQALHKLACEQAAAALDLQSVGQIDALRKALGVAPDVDPIATCRALGVPMEPRGAEPESKQESQQEQESEQKQGSN